MLHPTHAHNLLINHACRVVERMKAFTLPTKWTRLHPSCSIHQKHEVHPYLLNNSVSECYGLWIRQEYPPQAPHKNCVFTNSEVRIEGSLFTSLLERPRRRSIVFSENMDQRMALFQSNSVEKIYSLKFQLKKLSSMQPWRLFQYSQKLAFCCPILNWFHNIVSFFL
jgi:hypothetical protein